MGLLQSRTSSSRPARISARAKRARASAAGAEGHWSDRFLLVAEILSPSNDREKIDRKVELYCKGPENLHVLVVSQDAVKIVHRARSLGWRPDELGGEDRLVLPEFGFDVAVTELYRGTTLVPDDGPRSGE